MKIKIKLKFEIKLNIQNNNKKWRRTENKFKLSNRDRWGGCPVGPFWPLPRPSVERRWCLSLLLNQSYLFMWPSHVQHCHSDRGVLTNNVEEGGESHRLLIPSSKLLRLLMLCLSQLNDLGIRCIQLNPKLDRILSCRRIQWADSKDIMHGANPVKTTIFRDSLKK